MRDRVGEWHLSKKALVRNYRLVFNHHSKTWQGCTANLLETGRFEDTVHGAVYQITDEQLAKLQKYEGIPPVEIRVELDDGNEIPRAKTFSWKASNSSEQEPPKAYRKMIEEGLLQHGYSRSQVDSVFGRFSV